MCHMHNGAKFRMMRVGYRPMLSPPSSCSSMSPLAHVKTENFEDLCYCLLGFSKVCKCIQKDILCILASLILTAQEVGAVLCQIASLKTWHLEHSMTCYVICTV